METGRIKENVRDEELEYFENYEIKESDLELLHRGIDLLTESGLFEEGVLEEVRLVTYDSKYFYVFTKGRHSSNEKFNVEETPSSSKTGFRTFKIPHAGFVGKSRRDYKGARSWLLCDEIESTAVGAKKFPNENVVLEPDLLQPKKILDVVSVPPAEPYKKIQKGRYNYLTDVVFHETGHIEQRRLEDWQEGEEAKETFPSTEQKERFLAVIKQTKFFSESTVELIIGNINRRAISEMYAMIIDSEAAKRYDKQKFDDEIFAFQKILAGLRKEPIDEMVIGQFVKTLESEHEVGFLLVRILEEQFPDFEERKRFVRLVLQPVSRQVTPIPIS